jgi:hypothetical protein
MAKIVLSMSMCMDRFVTGPNDHWSTPWASTATA